MIYKKNDRAKNAGVVRVCTCLSSKAVRCCTSLALRSSTARSDTAHAAISADICSARLLGNQAERRL